MNRLNSADNPHSPLDASSLAANGEPVWAGLPRSTWIKILVIAGLFVWLFYVPCLRRLWWKTNPFTGEANWGHSIFVPIAGLAYLWLNREELLKAPVKPLLGGNFSRMRFISGGIVAVGGVVGYFLAPYIMPGSLADYSAGLAEGIACLGALAIFFDWGIGVLLWGLLVFTYGIYPGQNDWIKDFGMVATLFGVVLTLCGWQVMRIAWFPISFLICALPWPELVYSKIALPLQNLAAMVAVGVLNLTGADAAQVGTKIVIHHPLPPDRILNVAEACAGMRSLMTFTAMGATLAFLFFHRPLWQKLVITFSAIPSAIIANSMRVAGQGLLDRYFTEKLSEGFAHQFVGLVMLVPAFFLILLTGWLLDQIFIEEVDSAKPQSIIKVTNRPQPPAGGSPATAPRRPHVEGGA